MEEKTQQRPGERILLWFLMAFSLFALITALMIPHLENLSSSGAFPIFITSIMLASAATILWKNRKRCAALPLGEEIRQARPFAFPKIVIGYTAILLAYILLTAPLHFLPSTYLFLVGSFLFLKGSNLWKSLLIAAFMLAIIYVLFQTIFKVILW
jgi:hypothetical protein